MVDFNDYEEVKAGEKSTTKVEVLTEGIQSDFRTDAYWENVAEKETGKPAEIKEKIEKAKNSPALFVRCENGATMVINMPESKRIAPNSNLALWKNTYGDYPKEGQEVTTKTDDRGFDRIVLEK